jgi:hypothetical protein
MITDSSYSRFGGRAGAQPDAERIPPDDAVVAAAFRRILTYADRACCCTARPAVLAIMPASPDRLQHTDLLFCRHHYQASRVGLRGTGALIIGSDGRELREVRDREYAAA